MRLSARVRAQIDSPIAVTYDLERGRARLRPLLDLGQATAHVLPHPAVVEKIVQMAADDRGSAYTEIAGLPELRDAVAADVAAVYRSDIGRDQVVITAGCNQAFCLTTAVVAEPGDEVIMPLPYYFDHDMWLRLSGFVPRYVEPADDLRPSASAIAAAVTARTRAVVLVSPGNPTGISLNPDLIAAIADVARSAGIALIIDETYRSFRDDAGPPHNLFADARWSDTVISLHSFSKDLAIPGYRVGAVVAAPPVLRQVCKLLDCVAICAPSIGQYAALAGLEIAPAWRREQAAVIRARRDAFASAMSMRPGGFELHSCGAFFGWIKHPWSERPSQVVAADMAHRWDLLVVPGTVFLPDDRAMLRVSTNRLDAYALDDFTDRLTLAGTHSVGGQ